MIDLLLYFGHELAQPLQMMILELVAHGTRLAVDIASVRITVRRYSVYIVLFFF
jgi:hypothetical protein